MLKKLQNSRLGKYVSANQRKSVVVVFVLLFAVSGLYLLMQSRAATPAVSIEPEKGTITYPAKVIPDNSASGGSFIQFNSGASVTVDTWGNHMGISGEINKTNIDKVKSLGLGWIKFSSERDWTFDYSLIDYAHSQGIKVIETCQQTYGGGHNYPVSEVYNFANWCATWVGHHVDAIEIGNEWNHAQFWGGLDGTYTTQALYYDVTSQAIRAQSSTIPIITSGYSPETTPNLPYEAIGKALDASNGQFKSKADRIGAHGYAYNCDSPLKCEYPVHKDWSNFLATQDVYNVAKSKGFNHPVVFTELGGPSGNGTNLYTKQPFTQATQLQLYKDYMCGVALLKGGGVPVDLVMWHTMRDGEASTNSVEQTFGIYDASWNLKPAGWQVAAQASQPWTSGCVQ